MKKSIFILCILALLVSCKVSVNPEIVVDPVEPTEETESLEIEKEKQLTVMIYMPADNNLAGAAVADLNEMEEANVDYDKMNIVCLADISRYLNSEFDGAGVYKICRDENKDKSAVISKKIYCEKLGLSAVKKNQINTADPEVLKNFISFAKEYFPAKNYMFIIWGHGSGWRSEANMSNCRAVSFDDSEGKYLSLTDFNAALKEGMGEEKFSLIGFDTCFGNELEIAYELKDCTEYLCGTEGLEDSDGWDYSKLFNEIDFDNFSGKSIGINVCKQFNREFSVVDMSKVEALFNSFDNFMMEAAGCVISFEDAVKVKNEIRSNVINYYVSGTVSDLYVNIYEMTKILVNYYPELENDGKNLVAKIHEAVSPVSDGEYPLGVYFCSINKNNSIQPEYSELYVNGAQTETQIKFVMDSLGYVPSVTMERSFLDRLFTVYKGGLNGN